MGSSGIKAIEEAIRDIADFPKPGIIFKDITPVLKDAKLFEETIKIMADRWKGHKPDYVAGIESRGFIFASALAIHFACGFIPIRKKGKLPFETIEASYKLEYGEATLEMHKDSIKPGETVLLVDDLLATGGTICAAASLVEKLGGKVIGLEFLMELAFLNGRKNLANYKVDTLITVK